MYTYIYIYVYIHTCIQHVTSTIRTVHPAAARCDMVLHRVVVHLIFIHIYIERERHIDLCIYIYIYTYKSIHKYTYVFRARHVPNAGIGGELWYGVTSGVSCEKSLNKHVRNTSPPQGAHSIGSAKPLDAVRRDAPRLRQFASCADATANVQTKNV